MLTTTTSPEPIFSLIMRASSNAKLSGGFMTYVMDDSSIQTFDSLMGKEDSDPGTCLTSTAIFILGIERIIELIYMSNLIGIK